VTVHILTTQPQFLDVFWHFPTRGAIDFKPDSHSLISMKHMLKVVLLAGTATLTSPSIPAQTNGASPAASSADQGQVSREKHIKPVLAALKLADAAKEAKVHDILAAQFQALHVWHTENDAQIKPLWNEFNQARSKHSVTNADAALEKIDAVYAAFKPQHEKFLADLSSVLSPEQAETVKDVLTVNKVKVTYGVYLQLFPALTDAQKAVVLQDLKSAREQAIDCEAMTEKSAFFKKYKILIEDYYLTAQGYDPKQARKDLAAKPKADAAAKKGAEE